jgi:alpha-2-macroglobulin
MMRKITGAAHFHGLFVRISVALMLFAAAGMPSLASADERRAIISQEADYTGHDFSTLREVDLATCQATCIADQTCRAFTFDQRAGWCFLKSDFGPLSTASGSTAGRIVDSPLLTPLLEERRLGELSFLGTAPIDEARELVGALDSRFEPGDASYASLESDGRAAARAGDSHSAALFFGQALALAEDASNSWLAFATASNARSPERWNDKQEAWRDATAAAINAYLRAGTTEERADALNALGAGMANRELWKLAIRAFRASLALKDDQRLRARYQEIVAQHGFRILSHTVDADAARPRICVSFSDDLPVSRSGLADYIVVNGGNGLAVEPEQRQICIDGVSHGNRYQIRVRSGLPAADGETLAETAELNVYVRDRSPWVGFTGNAYVVPAGEGAAVPMVSVNTDTAKTEIYRISDRSLAGAVRDGTVLQQLSSYSSDQIAESTGEKVWEGEVDIARRLNEAVTTAIPLADAVPRLAPGAYVITARPATAADEWGPVATQWFVVSDLGVTTLSATDGIHVIIRSLATATPVAGASVRLVAANNEILGQARSNAEGYARFEPGLARGTGGMAPQIVDVINGSDYTFLDVARPPFDLTDRGVDGRPAPGPLDVFMTSERGIYRPGETVHLTALVRDGRADAVTGLPMTLVVERPDGVEFNRWTLSDKGAGGYSAAISLEDEAMRGSWHARLFADPKGTALADLPLLIEDFEPERLALEIDTTANVFSRSDTAEIDISARYLYGANAPGLRVDGELAIRPVTSLAGFAGYSFGLADDAVEPLRVPIDDVAETEASGAATLEVALPDLPATTRPLEAEAILRLADTNGRAVERRLVRPVEMAGPAIGIKPLFEGADVPEGGVVSFDAIMIAPDESRIADGGVEWSLERIETDYQWYRAGDKWNYEPVTTSRRVAGGTIDLPVDRAARIEAPVEWGRYRLTLTRTGAEPTASSVEFKAGWYVAATSVETPDVLAVALDKPAYAVGETARLRLDPRFAGIAQISVVDNRLISTTAVEVPEDGAVVELEVTEDWGPGAYITAALHRPMDLEAKRMPARTLGVAWAKVSPGDRELSISLDVADGVRPRGPMQIPVTIDNLRAGDRAFVTIAAVDVGILNLTGFEAPAPEAWYFGQRRLGAEIRDLYGLLIDRTQGEPGVMRSGGDGGPTRLDAPPPTQKLVALYSGIVEVDDGGRASVTFDLPQFNGSVRVMAMAWTAGAVGHAVKDVIVRDPVVVATSLPRFLATGDRSRMLVEIDNVDGPAGNYQLTVEASEGLTIAPEDAERTITLAQGQKTSAIVPISGILPGNHDVRVMLAPPSGDVLTIDLVLGVRPAGQPVTRRNVVAVNSGGTLTIGEDATAEFVPGTTSVTVSLSGAGGLDVAGILAALDRYPYGCAEQLTSRALPLVYLDDVAVSIGMGDDKAVRQRVEQAIVNVLAKQGSSGGFGLWGPFDGGDLWLDAYVSDFLARADEHGYEVPHAALDLAYDNLSNRLAYAQDFTNGGEDVAYALYVLARVGRAAIGDLRYYVEAKLDAFATPLAKAQIGAALSLYGDRQRATAAFSAAVADLERGNDDPDRWRSDYGTRLRDEAAILTLAAETKSEAVDVSALATRIGLAAAAKSATSTQEQSWMMLAAAALIRDAAERSFAIDGKPVDGPLFRKYDGSRLASSPITIANRGAEPLDAVVATTGIPAVAEPAGGYGYSITRSYYTPDGTLADVSTVGQNDRFVVVLRVVGDHARAARLLIVDPIPAGFEIENPNLSASGVTSGYDWLVVDNTALHIEARTDRFVAAVDRAESDPLELRVAYTVRAVAPGVFAQPGATVEDMYRPELSARTDHGQVEVVGPTR